MDTSSLHGKQDDSSSASSGHGLKYFKGLAIVALVALVVREHFILASVPIQPIRGDAAQYVNYAVNLIQSGIFSQQVPTVGTLAVPDAYRGPGYPLLLAGCMALGGVDWYAWALQLNALMGVATCILMACIAKPWVGPRWALAMGAVLALWPHHVAATGVLLSEVVFGFFLILATWCIARHLRSGRLASAAIGGAALGYAWLVNPLILLFAPVAVLVLWRRNGWRGAAMFALAMLLLVLPWAVRDAAVSRDLPGGGRATLNFIQGSWPDYHRSHVAMMRQSGDMASARTVMDRIGAETELTARTPSAGLAAVGNRMAADPWRYARWYLFEKPWLLWDWDIRVGAGDIYFLEYALSPPMERYPMLRAMKAGFRLLNPALFGLALFFSVLALVRARKGGVAGDPAACTMAAMFLYLTLVHVVFQAEPRYANAYRWLEVGLAMGCLAWVRQSGLFRLAKRGPALPEEA